MGPGGVRPPGLEVSSGAWEPEMAAEQGPRVRETSFQTWALPLLTWTRTCEQLSGDWPNCPGVTLGGGPSACSTPGHTVTGAL